MIIVLLVTIPEPKGPLWVPQEAYANFSTDVSNGGLGKWIAFCVKVDMIKEVFDIM